MILIIKVLSNRKDTERNNFENIIINQAKKDPKNNTYKDLNYAVKSLAASNTHPTHFISIFHLFSL